MNALTRFTSSTPVKFDVMNKMCTEIEVREGELEQEIQDKVTSAELTEFAETLSGEFANRDVKITELEAKNTEQDTAITEKVKVNNVSANVNFVVSDTVVEKLESGGKTLKLASNTDIVKDRATRTQEQINRTFYKQFCKEFTNTLGTDITVSNGMDGYILSSEIKGATKIFKRAKGSQDAWVEILSTETRDTNTYEYKLDSTQGILQNNGIQYPIYLTQLDATNKTPILLGGVESVYDSLIISEDASGLLTQNTNKVSWNGSENITLNSAIQEIGYTSFTIPSTDFKTNSKSCICDRFLNASNTSVGGEFIYVGLAISIKIANSKLATQDVAGFKAWLTANPVTVRYQLATPIITTIPKELMPVILTTKANTIGLASAVKPSSLKVSLPVDRIAELQSQITALQNAVMLLQS